MIEEEFIRSTKRANEKLFAAEFMKITPRALETLLRAAFRAGKQSERDFLKANSDMPDFLKGLFS
jgi:hypothetical protein